jgi:hypothetical protein
VVYLGDCPTGDGAVLVAHFHLQPSVLRQLKGQGCCSVREGSRKLDGITDARITRGGPPTHQCSPDGQRLHPLLYIYRVRSGGRAEPFTAPTSVQTAQQQDRIDLVS